MKLTHRAQQLRYIWGNRSSVTARRVYRKILLVNLPTALLVLTAVMVYSFLGVPYIVWPWLTVAFYAMLGLLMAVQVYKLWRIIRPPVIVPDAIPVKKGSNKRTSKGRNAKRRQKHG